MIVMTGITSGYGWSLGQAPPTKGHPRSCKCVGVPLGGVYMHEARIPISHPQPLLGALGMGRAGNYVGVKWYLDPSLNVVNDKAGEDPGRRGRKTSRMRTRVDE